MSNANSLAMTIIHTAIEVRFDHLGAYTAIGRDGWDIPNYPDAPLQVEVFKRGYHRVKLAVYGSQVHNIHEWGKWLCATLIDRDEAVWRHVDVSMTDV